jgi:hypothetical protein
LRIVEEESITWYLKIHRKLCRIFNWLQEKNYPNFNWIIMPLLFVLNINFGVVTSDLTQAPEPDNHARPFCFLFFFKILEFTYNYSKNIFILYFHLCLFNQIYFYLFYISFFYFETLTTRIPKIHSICFFINL